MSNQRIKLLHLHGVRLAIEYFHREVSCQGLYAFNRVFRGHKSCLYADAQLSALEMLQLAWLVSTSLQT